MKKWLNSSVCLISSLVLISCVKQPLVVPTRLSATEYLNLATNAAPQQKALYKLAAANKYIQQEKATQADSVLNTINPDIQPEALIEKKLLQAKIELLNNKLQAALATLNSISNLSTTLNIQQRIMRHQLLANTYEATGNTTASINQRTQLQPLLTNPQAQKLNLVAIWHSIQALSVDQLSASMNSTPSTSLKGWLSLALITKQATTPNNLIQSIRQWQSKYPNHAAINLLPKSVTHELQQTTPTPNIALLLPLHGRLRGSGESIRNGFLAAYYAAESKKINMPQLKIYDTSNSRITQVYQKALSDGATLIVGPLLKKHIQSLIDNGDISVPTLALNTLPNTKNTKHLFQFGLSPLDESQQAATRAFSQGYRRAAIITTNNAWGQNIASTFSQTWVNLGGQVIDTLNTSNGSPLEKPLQKLLHVDLANQDFKNLRHLLNAKMRFIPRRRKDIDVIYLAEQPSVARQIVPLLRYYFAGDIPVYSISQVYTTSNQSKQNHDLNGVIFCDMPWVLDPTHEPQALQDLKLQIETIWPASFSAHKKLYALGIDAYQLTSKLQQMKTLPQFAIKGATGDLYLDQASHIYRKLRWSQFHDGTPVLIN